MMMAATLTIDEERRVAAECFAARYCLRANALEAWMQRHNQRAYQMQKAVMDFGGDALMLALLNDEPLHEEAR